MSISPEQVEFTRLGDEVTLVAIVRDKAGEPMSVPVTWGSSTPSSVSISNRGRVRSVGCGGATITATAAGVTATADVWLPYVHTDPTKDSFSPVLEVDLASMTRRGDVLYVKDVIVGAGTEVTPGRYVTTQWKMWLPDGTPIPSGGQTSFGAGDGAVAPLLAQAVLGMRVGGKRRVVAGSLIAAGFWYGASRCASSVVGDIDLIR